MHILGNLNSSADVLIWLAIADGKQAYCSLALFVSIASGWKSMFMA